MPAPLLLLPPSKGKATGGTGPAYGATLDPAHPLTAPRRRVLDALAADVAGLDATALRRVAGVADRDLDAARTALPRTAEAATLPAHQRYTGVVHGNAGLAALDPSTVTTLVRIVSPLLGLAALDDPVPAYRLELTGSLPSLGGLGRFWRDALAGHLADLAAGRRVWDLLPGEHRRVWTPEARDAADVVDVRFLRPDGRAANAARTKVAKGQLAAALIARPALRPADLPDAVTLAAGWDVRVEGDVVVATFTG